jgi:hypothetical protein
MAKNSSSQPPQGNGLAQRANAASRAISGAPQRGTTVMPAGNGIAGVDNAAAGGRATNTVSQNSGPARGGTTLTQGQAGHVNPPRGPNGEAAPGV